MPNRSSSHSPPTADATARCVLLVDDDAGFRGAMRQVLEHRGYPVLEAADGLNGLALWQRHRDRVALVVSDVRMPALSGPDFVAAMHREDAEVPVVFVSSGADLPLPRDAEGHTPVLLRKPCSAADLAAAVGDAWHRRSPDR